MAETQFLEIPPTGWTNVSAVAGPNARITNIGEHMLIWRKAVNQPPAGNNDGHRLRDDNPFDYVLKGDEAMWMRTVNFKTYIAYTPDLAVGVLNGALDIHDADVHTIPANDFAHRHGNTTTLTAAANAGDTQINLADATGFTVGVYVHMGTVAESIEPIHPQVTAVAGTLITLDRPLDFSYPNGDEVSVSIVNMVTGSATATLAAPISYKYRPHSGQVEHIERLLLRLVHPSAAADDLFGSIPALINGVVIRASINGQVGTFTNWKDNGDIKLDMYDVAYTDKAGGGDFGTNGRGSFEEIGMVVRLDPATSDYLEVLVQDNLVGPGLIDFKIKFQGHIEAR